MEPNTWTHEPDYNSDNGKYTAWNLEKDDNLKDQLEDNPELEKFLIKVFNLTN